MILSKKHRILKELKGIFDERSYGNHNFTEGGKSLSRDELNIKTGIKINTLDNKLNALLSEELIAKTHIAGKGNLWFYYITPKGHNAYSDNRFLWYPIEKIVLLVTFVLALFGFLNSIFHWFDVVEKQKEVPTIMKTKTDKT